MELIIHIKMDLAVSNLQRLICVGKNHDFDFPDLRVAEKEKNKKAKMAMHSRFCTCLVSLKVTQTLGYLMQMR